MKIGRREFLMSSAVAAASVTRLRGQAADPERQAKLAEVRS